MLSSLAAILLVPYFGWGVVALRRKYRFHEEMSLVAEACTLLALVLFYALEMSLLRDTLAHNQFQYVVAVLGLITSGVALYGHMLISFSSRLIVEAVVPAPDAQNRSPRLGPAEALEHQKDYQGALQEYLVIARMYPKEHVVSLRIAQLHVQLSQPEEAVGWLKRAQKAVQTDAQALTVLLRQVELLELTLKRGPEAREVLLAFLAKYPDHPEGPSLRARLENIGALAAPPDTGALNALADTPLAQEEPPSTRRKPREKKEAAPVALSSLEDAPVMEEPVEIEVVVVRETEVVAESFSLELLDDAAPMALPEDDTPPREDSSSLSAMGLERLAPEEETPSGRKKKKNGA